MAHKAAHQPKKSLPTHHDVGNVTVYDTVDGVVISTAQGIRISLFKRIISQPRFKTIVQRITMFGYRRPFNPQTIRFEAQEFRLKQPLNLFIKWEDDCFVIHDTKLDIAGTGDTEEMAQISFGENFAATYRMLSETQNKNLTQYNINRKVRLKNLILNRYFHT